MKIKRQYFIDWLRVMGVYIIIPFHAALIFDMNPDSIVYIKDTINVDILIRFQQVINRFDMPLLFVIAGISAYFSLQVRTQHQFVIERFKKLLLPAVLGCIFLNPIMTYIYLYSKNENPEFIKHIINFFTKNPGNFNGISGAFTPAHLWFIIYLFIFSLILLPIFIKIIEKDNSKTLLNLSTFFEKPLAIMLLIIPVIIFCSIDILGDQNPFLYLPMFFIGFIIATNKKYLKALNRDKWIYLILSIILIYVKFHISCDNKIWSFEWILNNGLIDKSSKLVPVFALLGLGQAFLNKDSKILKYLSKASFPIYIIHMLVLTIVGYFVVKLSINPFVKYMIIVSMTYLICFGIYEIYKRFKLLVK